MVNLAVSQALEKELLLHLVSQVSRIEKQLDDLISSNAETEWLDLKSFAKLAGTTEEGVRWAVKKGVVSGDGIRNVGNKTRKYLRFHRKIALNQFLKRVVAA